MFIKNLYNFKKLGKFEKKLIMNSFIALMIKMFSLIISLFIIPAYINFFSDDNILGFWLTIITFFAWFLTFDLGIGNGLRQRLISSIAKKDNLRSKRIISSTYILTFWIVIFFIITFSIFSNMINWNNVFNIDKNLISFEIMNEIVIIIFMSVMINFLLRIVNSVLHAIQKSGLVNLTSFLTNLLILIIVFIFEFPTVEQKLIFLSYFYFFALNIPLIFMNLYVFKYPMKYYFPKLKYFNMNVSKKVLKIGISFFFIQIMFLMIYGTNEYLITIFTETKNVVNFQIYSKFFFMISSIYTIVLIPIWSAVNKKVEEKDYKWIRKISKYSFLLAVFFVIIEVVVLFLLPILLRFWLGNPNFEISNNYSFVFFVMASTQIFFSLLSSLSNGLSLLKSQTILLLFSSVLNIPLAFLFVNILESWIGVVLANIISLIIYCVVQPFIINRNLKVLERK